jgi:transcriptional regulator with PAS, ATPase and Fis domain
MSIFKNLLYPSAVGRPLTPAEIQARLPLQTRAQASTPLLTQRMQQYITVHKPTQEMLHQANLCAQTPHPVLIEGESGTGKELVARIMLGNRQMDKFFSANCAGIVDTLFESLIFGHVKGAYSGAVTDKQGLLVAAGDGVVFLDEIGELPLNQQAKLLRAIQERLVTPVGSVEIKQIRCRFVFATNRNLPAMVKAGTFREDLYYRISPLRLHTYPLRVRPDDADLIMEDICTREKWEPVDEPIPQEVINSPGNVRALINWITRYQVLGITEWTG